MGGGGYDEGNRIGNSSRVKADLRNGFAICSLLSVRSGKMSGHQESHKHRNVILCREWFLCSMKDEELWRDEFGVTF